MSAASSPGATPLRVISREEARRLLRGALHVEDTADALAMDCAVLRSVVWALTSSGAEPVHTLRVVNAAVEADADAVETREESRREQLRRALDELGDVYDLAPLPRGRWLPAPARVVPLEGPQGGCLLVGGVPTHLLPAPLSRAVAHHGTARRSQVEVLEALRLPVQPLASWLGLPAEPDIAAWTAGVLSASQLSAYEAATEDDRFNVYSPMAVGPGASQFGRWVAPTAVNDGRYLAARARLFGGRDFRVVEVRRGTIVKSGAPDSGFGDPRRLMYGLDLQAGRPVSAERRRVDGGMRYALRSELPHAERRLFGALARLETPTDRYYPRWWTFAPAFVARAESALRDLGITLTEATESK